MVDAVVVIGIVASVGMIGVSVALNARMGYGSADTDVDGKLYGAGAGLGDCLKAMAPFMLGWAVKNRDPLAAASAALLFGICTAYSFTAALGFAAQHRAEKAGVAQGEIDARKDARAEKKRIEDRLSFLGPQRSSDEVRQAREAIFRQRAWANGRTVGEVSENCALNRKSTREPCAKVAALGAELARAEEVEGLTQELKAVFKKMPKGEVVLVADAQVDALSRFANFVTAALKKEDIGFGLSLLLALFIELGSGLGLYMVTTPWRGGKGAAGEIGPEGPKRREPRKLGHVDAFMLERLEPADGRVFLDLITHHYRAWCETNDRVAYRDAEFGKRFEVLARELGFEGFKEGARIYFRGIGLKRR